MEEFQQTNLEKLKKITIQATGSISWRQEGIKYRFNELFIDIVENINVLFSNRGTVLRSDVIG
jgi:AP-2 complex subunit mu-1